MKFSCGESWESVKARLSEWHPYFALWPRVVAVHNGRLECRWLETIERRGTLHWLHLSGWSWSWSYRAPMK